MIRHSSRFATRYDHTFAESSRLHPRVTRRLRLVLARTAPRSSAPARPEEHR